MADLSKIKVGDILRRDFRVVRIDESDTSLPVLIVAVDGGSEDWATMDEVEAAEHILAPQVFKRGDWVRHAKDTPSRYGLVTKVRNGTAALGGLITVSWPDGPAYDYYVGDLEPDEAPE